jgi:hypothetical protein
MKKIIKIQHILFMKKILVKVLQKKIKIQKGPLLQIQILIDIEVNITPL